MGAQIRLWDARTGELRAVLPGHRLTVSSVALDASGRTLVSGSYDGTVKTWVDGELVDRLDAPGGAAVSGVKLSADGARLAVACTDGTVFIRDAGEEVVVDTWVSHFGKTRSLRKYLIRRPADDCVLVTAETNWALVDIAKRRPRRIPQEIIDAFTLGPECEEPKPKQAPEPARTE